MNDLGSSVASGAGNLAPHSLQNFIARTHSKLERFPQSCLFEQRNHGLAALGQAGVGNRFERSCDVVCVSDT
jgi:hypothetical protein